MHCAIYKGNKRPDDYLYIENENDFSRVPKALLDMMGKLHFVISLELSADRQLAQADVHQVMRQLTDQGYYLQMPPKVRDLSLEQ